MVNILKVFLRETYAPELLKRRARALRKSTGDISYRSVYERPDRHWTSVFRRGMIRPIKFLLTEPIVQVFALYMAVLYGVLYLTLTSYNPSRYLYPMLVFLYHLDWTAFVKVFTEHYGEDSGIAGLHYLAIALGSTGKHASGRPVYLFLTSLITSWRPNGCPSLRLYL